ncbi:MAG: DNA N-6-adenine-methyltransferase, partial [Chloroflexota bacterium]|nr:DNA N-6-adenine-methyltransferase [Chloroflexota bacterium]
RIDDDEPLNPPATDPARAADLDEDDEGYVLRGSVTSSPAAPPRSNAVAALTSSASNEWHTPAAWVERVRTVLGRIDLDPASALAANDTVRANTICTADDDGLTHEWHGQVFCNPPYGKTGNQSNQGLWLKKMIAEYKTGHVTEAIMLIKAVPGEEWFQSAWDYPICFISGRIAFTNGTSGSDDGNTGSSCFVYFGADPAEFVRVFSPFGPVVINPIRPIRDHRQETSYVATDD